MNKQFKKLILNIILTHETYIKKYFITRLNIYNVLKNQLLINQTIINKYKNIPQKKNILNHYNKIIKHYLNQNQQQNQKKQKYSQIINLKNLKKLQENSSSKNENLKF